MSEPFIGEIRIFGGNFAPRGWAFCDGQRLPVAQYDALFSLLGTTYGGDGRNDFGLPDLRGRAPIHDVFPGQKGGVESITLTTAQLPPHTHSQSALDTAATSSAGVRAQPTLAGRPVNQYVASDPGAAVIPDTSTPTGGWQSHPNGPPELAVSFIIALVGLYPSRS